MSDQKRPGQRLLILNRYTDRASQQPTARLLQDVCGGLAIRHIAVETVAAQRTCPRHTHADTQRVYGRFASLWVMLWRGLRAARPDMVVCKSDPPMVLLVARLLGWWHRCPVVYWCQDIYPDMLRAVAWPWPLRRPAMAALCGLTWFHGLLMRGTALRIVPAPGMADALRRHDVAACRTTPIVVQPNWPEPDLQPAPLPAAIPLTILYSGHYGYGHDLTDLIAVARTFERRQTSRPVRFRVCLSPRGLLRWERRHGQTRLPGNLIVEPLVTAQSLADHLAAAHIHVVAIDDRVSQALAPSKAVAAMRLGRPILLFGGAASSLRLDIERHNLGIYVPAGEPDRAVDWLEQVGMAPDGLAVCREAVLAFDKSQQSRAHPAHMTDLICRVMPSTRLSPSGAPSGSSHHFVADPAWEERDAR